MGAGDFAREVYEYHKFCKIEVDGFYDQYKNETTLRNKPIYKDLKEIKNIKEKKFIVGTGNCSVNSMFLNLIEQNNLNLSDPLICDSYIGEGVRISKGSIICPKSVLTCDINIGKFVVINISCTIGHDCVIEDSCVLSPNVSLSGHTTLEKEVFFGTGAISVPSIFVKNKAIVGANSTVIKKIEESGVYIGSPAKKK